MMLQVGFVKWYNPIKGFGFISPQDGSNDIYVCRANIANSKQKVLTAGQQVEYSIYMGSRGLSADDVIAY